MSFQITTSLELLFDTKLHLLKFTELNLVQFFGIVGTRHLAMIKFQAILNQKVVVTLLLYLLVQPW